MIFKILDAKRERGKKGKKWGERRKVGREGGKEQRKGNFFHGSVRKVTKF